jgi:outer membrane immunogenic protein
VKKLLLATTALTAFAAGGSANAADMPVKAAPAPIPAPVAAIANWTGFYVGLNAGGAWGRSDLSTSVPCNTVVSSPPFPYICTTSDPSSSANGAALSAAGTGSMSGSAFTGGGQVGYNWQFDRAVFGVEADFESFNIKASRQSSGNYPAFSLIISPTTPFTIGSSISTDWLFTARGRVGWTFNNLLVYGTGGLAVTDLKATNSYVDTNLANPGFPGTGTWNGSETKLGWTAGGGVEWALNRNWSVKAEYLYVKFGSITANGVIQNPQPAGYASGISTSTDLTAQIARAGVNYKF